MYLNDDLFASSEAFTESVDDQIRPAQSSLMFTPSHTSTNSSAFFSFQRTHYPNFSYFDLFDLNYEPYHFVVIDNQNSESEDIPIPESKPNLELPSPKNPPPFPNMIEQGLRHDLENDEEKGTLRLERQKSDLFNWNDMSTSPEQQKNYSFSNISEATFNNNMQMQHPMPPNTNFLMMYYGVAQFDPRAFNQNPPRSYSNNVEQTQLFQDFFQARTESMQNLNTNRFEDSALISTRDSTKHQYSSANSNKFSEDEEKVYSDDKKEITFKIKEKPITKKALLSSKQPAKIKGKTITKEALLSSNQPATNRNRKTFTHEQKLGKIPNNYIRKTLGDIFMKEILGGTYNDYLEEVKINRECFITWLKELKYGNLQVCKKVWSHKEWDKGKGKEHDYNVTLTKLTRKFLEKNCEAKWKEKYCRIKEYKKIYEKVDTLLLEAMGHQYPESLNFNVLFEPLVK